MYTSYNQSYKCQAYITAVFERIIAYFLIGQFAEMICISRWY